MNSIAHTSSPSRNTDPRFLLDFSTQLDYLKDEWRLMFRPGTMASDVLAGLAVALVALPLSLAIANASGVNPEVGLITAIVGGIVVAFFGGSRLQVSGPAAAMTFLVFEIVTKFGIQGLMAATLIAGMLQIGAGLLRAGRSMRLIPRPVIAGFLSGIGLTIICTQLPVVLGYDVSHDEEGGAVRLLWNTLSELPRTEPTALAVGLTTIAVMLIMPKVSRRLPVPLIAVILGSLLPTVLGWSTVPLLGEMPTRFPVPTLPRVPWELWNELVMSALAIFVLASLESLLSASVVESLVKDLRTDNDQELIGQGLGNLTSAVLGGIPVTGVIARSATNIQAGGRTRLAAVAHALMLLAMLVFLAPVVAQIPKAALAGVLIAVATRMVEVRMFRTLWRGSRVESVVFLITAGSIVLTDLIVGIPIGMIVAFIYVVVEMSHLNLRQMPLSGTESGPESREAPCPSVQLIRVEGPLFFASGFHLRSMVNKLGTHRCLVLDLEKVPFLDVTGAEILEETVELLGRQGKGVVLARPTPAVARRLRELTRYEFPALRVCPVYETIRDAMLHAAAELATEHLCDDCALTGQCADMARAMCEIGSLDQTPVPRVRAIISRVGSGSNWDVKSGSAEQTDAMSSGLMTSGSIRPSPLTSWNPRNSRPTIHSTAFVDPLATVIGAVTVGERVYIGPGVSVRADEGTPFHIGAESNLQDGVTLHALKGKVVMVQGRPFAIYVGRNVCLTHHALIHGPCFIGDRCFIGFKTTVHDATVGEGCVLGLGAVVVGVSIPDRRYVGHGVVVDTQEKADALPPVDPQWERLRDEVVEVNQELAAGHLEHGRGPGGQSGVALAAGGTNGQT